MQRIAILFFALGLASAQDNKQWGPMVLTAIKGLMEWQPRAKGFEYDFQSEEKKLALDGSLKEQNKVKIAYKEIDVHRWGMVLERNGQPTTEKQRKEQQERTATRIAAAKSESESAKEKRRKDAAKKHENNFGFLRDFPDSFEFKLVEKTKIAGREISVITFTPRPGYKPSQMRARIFTKVNGKIWLDEADLQAAKLTAEVFDDLSLGGIFVNLGKGTYFEFSQTRVENAVWLPDRTYTKVFAKVLLLKSFNSEETEILSNYRKVKN